MLFSAALGNLISGIQPSACPLPCETVSTEIQLADETEARLGFQLLFQQRVQVGNKLFQKLQQGVIAKCENYKFTILIYR